MRSRKQNAVVYSESNRWPSNSFLPESLKFKKVGALFAVIHVGESNMVRWNQGGCRASGQPHTEVKGISSLQGLQDSHVPSFSTEKMCQCPHIFFFSSFPFQERSVKGKASPSPCTPHPHCSVMNPGHIRSCLVRAFSPTMTLSLFLTFLLLQI